VKNTILVAGIGNIFHRDDAFGVAVTSKMSAETWPENVRIREFGIRGFDLGMELLDEPALTILVDAMVRGNTPGTLYTLEVDPETVGHGEGEFENAHGLNPTRVLAIARQSGARLRRVLVVGCEPATLEDESGAIGLSAAVEAVVEPAIDVIRSLIEETNQLWAEQAATTEVRA
jgi:hydrogenase maturation protease